MNTIHNPSFSLQQETGGVRHIAATSPLAAKSILSGTPLSGVSFHQVMRNALEHVDSIQQAASARQSAVSSGQSDDLIGAMLASQQASLSFSALVQVRNKVASGVNDLMNMSI